MMRHLAAAILAVLAATLASAAQPPPAKAVGSRQEAVGSEEKSDPKEPVSSRQEAVGGESRADTRSVPPSPSPTADCLLPSADCPPLDRRRVEFDIRRRQALLDRCRERLARYQKDLTSLGPVALPSIEGPDEPLDAAVDVRRATDRHGRTVYAIEADRATLQASLEALATEARADLLLDQGVSVRDLSSFLTIALDGVTLRQALELLLGGFELDFILGDGQLVVTLPSKGPYRTAEERLRQRAERAYQAALVEFPNSSHAPRSHLTLGQYFHARRLHTQAIETLGQLVRDYPRSEHVPAARYALGESYAALGDPKNATLAYQAIVTQHPNSPFVDDALLALARGHAAAREHAKAIPLLEEALQRPGARPSRRLDASLLLCECLLGIGRQSEALTRLDTLLAGDLPADVERRGRLLAARALMDAGDYARARAAFYRLAGKFPATPEGGEARYLLAETYFRENAHLAAVEAFRSALTCLPKAPQAPEATFRLAKLYQQMTLYDLAIDTCERLLADGRLSVSRRAVLETLAECCADQGNFLKAQRSFERAAEGARDPEAMQALFQAAHAALADQRPADALPLVQRVADQATDKALVAQALTTLGDCHRQLGRLDAALAAYRRAAQAAGEGEAPAEPRKPGEGEAPAEPRKTNESARPESRPRNPPVATAPVAAERKK